MNKNFLIGLIGGLMVSTLIFGTINSYAQEEEGEEKSETKKEDKKPKEEKKKEENKSAKHGEKKEDKKEDKKEEGKDEKDGKVAKPPVDMGPVFTGLKSMEDLDEVEESDFAEDKNIKVVYKIPETCKEFTLYLDDKAYKLEKREKEIKQQERLLAQMQIDFDALTKKFTTTEERVKGIMQHDPSNLKGNPELEKMVRLYETFSAEEAAQRLQNLDLDLTIAILRGMKPKVLSKIMTAMDPHLSAALSSKLVRGF